MSWISDYLSSSIGKKQIMAASGLALVLFLFVHLAGNLSVFAGREATNGYAIALREYGALLWVAPQLPWLGKLPGDLRIERPGFTFYFPITTCLVISAVLTMLLQLFSRWR